MQMLFYFTLLSYYIYFNKVLNDIYSMQNTTKSSTVCKIQPNHQISILVQIVSKNYFLLLNNINLSMVSEKEIKDSLIEIKKNAGLQNQLNHVRSVFSNNYPSDKQVKVYYSSLIPSIWIISKDKKTSKKLYTHSRDFLYKKSQPRHLQIIDRIFSKLYRKIEQQYWSLIEFGLEKAIDLKINHAFTYNEIMLVKQLKKKLMFYCCYTYSKKEDIFGFTLFSRKLLFVEFDSNFVNKLKKYLPDQFGIYQDMIDYYYPIVDTSIATNNSSSYIGKASNRNIKQAQKNRDDDTSYSKNSSRTQSNFIEKQNSKTIKSKLESLLKKDLRRYEREQNNLYHQWQQLQKRYNRGEMIEDHQLDNIQEEYNEYSEKLKAFEDTRQEIEAKLQRNHRNYTSLYKKILMSSKQLDSKLPINAKKAKIIQSLNKYDLIILEGQTGSGKSTQLPQILCEYFDLFSDENGSLPILITQPRKLATKSIAQRVAQELQEEVGDFVDYVDTDSRNQSKRAKIVFKLDRIVLDEMISDPSLSNYSCLVLDEAHERTINIDVIIGILKKLFQTAKKSFKVIITSASMDIKLFQRYFQIHCKDIRCKTIKVPGRQYPVTINYLDYHFLKSSTQKIEKALNQEIITNRGSIKRSLQGNILVFCTSVEEINTLVERYSKKLDKNVFCVLSLHGRLTSQEQALVFKKTHEFKLIFCTRIAETAITIDGVTVVIDPGEDYQKVFDQKSKISSMTLKNISQSAAKQRAGRAGRTNSGHCFRLYGESSLQRRPPNQIPEIENQSLQIIILRLKQLNIDNPSKFEYLSPPSISALQASEQLLKMIGALDENNKLNSIGRLLIKLPIQPFLSRAVAQGLIYEALIDRDEDILRHFRAKDFNRIKKWPISKTIIQILCMINAERLFTYSEDQQQTQRIRFENFSNEKGDFFYLQNIYDKFMELRQQTSKAYQLRIFLSKYELNYKSLMDVSNNQKEMNQILRKQGKINLNFINKQIVSRCTRKMENSKNYEDLILSCLLSSFGANLAIYSQHPQFGYTLLKNKINVKLYGTSTLSLQGIFPKWIIGYNLYQSDKKKIYFKIAHEVKEEYFDNQFFDEYLCKKIEIPKFIQGNPFFTRKQYNTSTYIAKMIEEHYFNRQRYQSFNWMNENIEILFNECSSNFTLFIRSEENKAESHIKIFQNYLQSLQKNLEELQRFNYLGNRIVLFDKNFEFYQIEFNIKEYALEISKMNSTVFNLVFSQCYGFGKLEPIDEKTIRIYLDDIKDSRRIKDQLQNYKTYGSFHIKDITIIRNHSEPNIEMLIYFFAGQPSQYNDSNNVVLFGYDQETIEESVQYLNQAIYFDKSRNNQTSLKIKAIYSTKKCVIKMETCLDQIEMQNYIDELVRSGLMNRSFTYPSCFLRYREPSYPESSFTDQQWKQQIHKKLSRYADLNDCIITISQFNKAQYNDYSSRINLCAKISISNSSICQALSKRINNKSGIIGCDKAHVITKFTLNACTVPAFLYQHYQQKITQICEHQRRNGNMFQIHYTRSYNRNSQLDMLGINLSSIDKKMLFSPAKSIKQLFIPKIIRLTKAQADIFNHRTDSIMIEMREKIQAELLFDYKSKQIRVYCDEYQIKQINSEIKDLLATKQIKKLFISYKGKNLNKVLEIAKSIENNHQKNEFSYQINFKNRGIQLNGALQLIEECRQSINQITEKINPQCQLCQDTIRINFTLHNCHHQFCCECMVNYCREQKGNYERDQLQFECPFQSKGETCGSRICIQDIKMIFSEEQFRSICDIKIKRHINKHNSKYSMCSNCAQIFQKDPQIRNCNFCGSEMMLNQQS